MSIDSSFNYEYTDKATISILASTWTSSFKKKIDRNPGNPKISIIERAHSITTQILKALSEPHAHLIIAKKGLIPCSILIADDEREHLTIRFLVTNVLNPDAKGSGTFLVTDLVNRLGKTKTLKLVPERSLKYWQKLNFKPNPLDGTTLILENETSIPKMPSPKKSPARGRLKH
jgi:hypothetical protein